MQNLWTETGESRWTFEVHNNGAVIVPESQVTVDDRPCIQVTEESVEDGAWTPVSVVWEEFTCRISPEALAAHNHIRLVEADGSPTGILRRYEGGHPDESFVMYGLVLKGLDPDGTATFSFHHALCLA